MKGLLLSLALALSLPAFGANNLTSSTQICLMGSASYTASGNNNGAVCVPSVGDPATVGNWFILHGGAANATDGRVFPFYKSGVKYQVTAGKTALCTHAEQSSGGVGLQWQLFYDTVTFSNDATTAGLTAPVWQGGASSAWAEATGATGSVPKISTIMYTFPAASFPGTQIRNPSGNSLIVKLLCKEI